MKFRPFVARLRLVHFMLKLGSVVVENGLVGLIGLVASLRKSKPALGLQFVARAILAATLYATGCYPFAAVASELFGTADTNEGFLTTIDPKTGASTRLGTATFTAGSYAPVFDPRDRADAQGGRADERARSDKCGWSTSCEPT